MQRPRVCRPLLQVSSKGTPGGGGTRPARDASLVLAAAVDETVAVASTHPLPKASSELLECIPFPLEEEIREHKVGDEHTHKGDDHG